MESKTDKGNSQKSSRVGIPWWSNGEDSELPLQGAQAQSLVREQRSCVPSGVAKKEKKRKATGWER